MLWPTVKTLESMCYDTLDDFCKAIAALKPDDPHRKLFLFSRGLCGRWFYARAACLEQAKLIAAVHGWDCDEELWEIGPSATAEQLDLMEACSEGANRGGENGGSYFTLLIRCVSRIAIQQSGGELVPDGEPWDEVRDHFAAEQVVA
jgi:hypothetical protein